MATRKDKQFLPRPSKQLRLELENQGWKFDSPEQQTTRYRMPPRWEIVYDQYESHRRFGTIINPDGHKVATFKYIRSPYNVARSMRKTVSRHKDTPIIEEKKEERQQKPKTRKYWVKTRMRFGGLYMSLEFPDMRYARVCNMQMSDLADPDAIRRHCQKYIDELKAKGTAIPAPKFVYDYRKEDDDSNFRQVTLEI